MPERDQDQKRTAGNTPLDDHGHGKSTDTNRPAPQKDASTPDLRDGDETRRPGGADK